MKTVPELAKEIENNPDQVTYLLDSFRTTDHDLRMFLFSLKQVPVQIIPSLLITFYREQERSAKKTVLDVIKSNDVGLLFEVKELGSSYRFTGFDKDNNATFCKLGSSNQEYLNADLEIKWIF